MILFKAFISLILPVYNRIVLLVTQLESLLDDIFSKSGAKRAFFMLKKQKDHLYRPCNKKPHATPMKCSM
ncbi:MAG TPA: hypothetical protein DCR97_03225 [Deltaproteobacteria bacterium]|nr:hypothetical protein [Deltaproteobacteria bacterium]